MAPIVDDRENPPGLEVVLVSADTSAVSAAGDEIPSEYASAILPVSVLETEGVAASLARVDGEPVAASMLVLTDDVCRSLRDVDRARSSEEGVRGSGGQGGRPGKPGQRRDSLHLPVIRDGQARPSRGERGIPDLETDDATRAGYVGLSGTLTFGIGESTVTVLMTPIDDAEVESDETVIVSLDASSEYELGASAEATVVIEDDDEADGGDTGDLGTKADCKNGGWKLARPDFEHLYAWLVDRMETVGIDLAFLSGMGAVRRIRWLTEEGDALAHLGVTSADLDRVASTSNRTSETGLASGS